MTGGNVFCKICNLLREKNFKLRQQNRIFAFCSISYPESSFPLTSDRKNELWQQPFQACAIDADCAVKPDGQNSVISFVISKWLLPELSFSYRWSRGTKTLGARLGRQPPDITSLATRLLYKEWYRISSCQHFHLDGRKKFEYATCGSVKKEKNQRNKNLPLQNYAQPFL